MFQDRELDMDDVSDDVSALSMDGASAIAGMVPSSFAKRLRKDFAKLEATLEEEDDEGENDCDSPSRVSRRTKEQHKHDGDELIEPFPQTYEEWQRKKEKKMKKKEKKHKKEKSSKSSRSSRHKKEKVEDEMNSIGGGKGPPPIMEIAISDDYDSNNKKQPSSPYRKDGGRGNASNLSGHPSQCTSTADDSESDTHRGSSSYMSGSVPTGRTSSSRRHNKSSHLNASIRSQRSAHPDDHSMASQTHLTSQSNINAELLDKLRTNIEKAKIEEKQVTDIFNRLEDEIQTAEVKSEKAKLRSQQIGEEIQNASLERETLHTRLDKLQHQNNKLKMKLRNLQQEEDDKGLDDVLNSMEAKIKALKLKSGRQRSSTVRGSTRGSMKETQEQK